MPEKTEKGKTKCRVQGSKNVDGKIKVDYACEGKDGEMKPKTTCIDGKTGQKARCPKEK